MVAASLAGLPAFLAYLSAGVLAVVLYIFIYTRITPIDEFALIGAGKPAAAITLGMSLIGFVLPLASAIAHSANIVDCAIWSVIALIVQVAAFFVARIPVKDLPAKIERGDIAAALWLGSLSVAAGVLSAASMTY